MSPGALFRRAGVQIGLLLSAVFLAGLLGGIALDRTMLARSRAVLIQRGAPPQVDRMVRRLERALDLSEEQAAGVRAVLERRQPRVRAIWGEARASLLAQVDSVLLEFSAVLTPEQQDRVVRLLRARGIRVERPEDRAPPRRQVD